MSRQSVSLGHNARALIMPHIIALAHLRPAPWIGWHASAPQRLAWMRLMPVPGGAIIRPSSTGLSQTWRPRASLLSGRYTTRLSEIVNMRSW
ncbi:DUF4113 domain-containing protein [Gluconobacter cerinus]|uniref:DUF4113 domain-containing protein n=1 Tax=Gluconobacter cerinus TaxID=38307 RepID=UPI0038CF3D40